METVNLNDMRDFLNGACEELTQYVDENCLAEISDIVQTLMQEVTNKHSFLLQYTQKLISEQQVQSEKILEHLKTKENDDAQILSMQQDLGQIRAIEMDKQILEGQVDELNSELQKYKTKMKENKIQNLKQMQELKKKQNLQESANDHRTQSEMSKLKETVTQSEQSIKELTAMLETKDQDNYRLKQQVKVLKDDAADVESKFRELTETADSIASKKERELRRQAEAYKKMIQERDELQSKVQLTENELEIAQNQKNASFSDHCQSPSKSISVEVRDEEYMIDQMNQSTTSFYQENSLSPERDHDIDDGLLLGELQQNDNYKFQNNDVTFEDENLHNTSLMQSMPEINFNTQQIDSSLENKADLSSHSDQAELPLVHQEFFQMTLLSLKMLFTEADQDFKTPDSITVEFFYKECSAVSFHMWHDFLAEKLIQYNTRKSKEEIKAKTAELQKVSASRASFGQSFLNILGV